MHIGATAPTMNDAGVSSGEIRIGMAIECESREPLWGKDVSDNSVHETGQVLLDGEGDARRVGYRDRARDVVLLVDLPLESIVEHGALARELDARREGELLVHLGNRLDLHRRRERIVQRRLVNARYDEKSTKISKQILTYVA